MRFRCNKAEPCKFCGECCKFPSANLPNEDEERVKKALFEKTGTLYIYSFDRFGLSVNLKEKAILEEEAEKQDKKITILPKKVFITDKGPIIFDYFLDAKVCPFLKNNKCTIYKQRPNICRQFPKVENDNKDFLKFQEENNLIKEDYEKCLKEASHLL